MITEKTFKEEWTYKNYFYDNYNLVQWHNDYKFLKLEKYNSTYFNISLIISEPQSFWKDNVKHSRSEEAEPVTAPLSKASLCEATWSDICISPTPFSKKKKKEKKKKKVN